LTAFIDHEQKNADTGAQPTWKLHVVTYLLAKNRGWIMILQVWSALDNISIHQFHPPLIKCLVDWRCLKIACSRELHTSFVRKPPSGSKYFTSAASINHQARQASLQPSDSHGTLKGLYFQMSRRFHPVKGVGALSLAHLQPNWDSTMQIWLLVKWFGATRGLTVWEMS